ncbi:MAG TPA: agmatine deiminase family protein [Geminicoccaceae bacterium]|nr:agmatine deiminase family protein [Geminicoccaceae bacterium]
MSTPRAQGFAMPPEWAPHSRCWMAWPCRSELWGERMTAARRAFAELAKAIAAYEPVTVLARPDLTAEASLHCGQGISVLPLDYDDTRIRDTAPSFLLDRTGSLAGVDWRYDGYGGRAPAFEQDARLAEAICARLDVPRFVAPIVLEGGGVQVDGEGTALVCAASVLDPKRNPGLGRAEIERALSDYLAVDKVIWLEHGFDGDVTGGHVDDVARFVRPGVVMVLTCRDQADANFAAFQDNLERLRGAQDAAGRELEVIEVEQPAPRSHPEGYRLTTSYLSFYLANGAVLVPMFDDAKDNAAYAAINAAFADRRAIQIDAGDLAYAGGIHALVREQPVAA